ncbi:3-keto-5-aminohexanoate cleavage protein [Zavarzinia aquatilis]|uniref:3-keto-5-aminohexanoate cleavage protein n=1 Tax=Zavarzinia aquatilis TaxID=2211142 RepID=A0A317EEN7_9PROT|nr:3-keto-5-aminohexanoate cleavage protein [Zavarzinia aquatilis]PWR25221.1 3-keto-5-aminohexanoate cleavage protein [Zavarzinia aquatilis]
MITVAPTGAELDAAAVPALPASLDALVAAGESCEAAGAAMIHVHVRDGAGRPSLDPALLGAAVAALRRRTGLIVQLSTGGSIEDGYADRLRVLDVRPDSCSISMGTVNFGEGVFLNPWPFIVALHQRARDLAIVPEYEIFDLGHLANLRRLLDEKGLPHGGRVHCDFVMGVPGGMPGDLATLAAALQALPPQVTSWSATGIGKASLPVMLAALSAGGNLRVGIEDTIHFAVRRPVRDNAELVGRAADLCALAQRPPMTPAAARGLLNIAA